MNEDGRTGEAIESVQQRAEEVFESAKDYAKGGAAFATGLTGRLANFVQEDPWLAVAGAFVLGYAAAQLIKRIKK